VAREDAQDEAVAAGLGAANGADECPAAVLVACLPVHAGYARLDYLALGVEAPAVDLEARVLGSDLAEEERGPDGDFSADGIVAVAGGLDFEDS